ncbi:MAG: tripartite tricarboxylate transporter permease [Betaproteobacteria bacterium]|nr:tripartite tricarboxylate transporter permease [Betaproteobacteria bacterium]
MLESTLTALELLFTVRGLLFLGLGTVIGLVFGVIPGLGGTTAIALLIPLTFSMQPYEAITLMGGIMGSVSFGGSITAILLNTPGIAPAAATCFDGYPLAQQGKAGLAIGAAGAASSVGGLIGVVILVAVIPLAKQIVLLFGPPEFFMLAIMGLSAIALSTGGRFLRGLISGLLGLLLSFVGYDAVSGGIRFTAGSEYLWDGISLVPALTGLFAISEMINLSVKGGTVVTSGQANVRITRVTDGVRAVFTHFGVTLRGSAIGAFIGAVPGVGGTVAAFLSYASTLHADRDPASFGKGNIKGVIAPEAANNSKDGGALIPTLAFGIPGSAEMAIFMGVLVQHGIEPGPMLLIEHQGIAFSLILALSLSCVLATAVGLAVTRQLALITLVDVHILVPSVVAISLVGVYALHSDIGDVILAFVFGGLGYFMIRFGYPRITMVIALVLGELAERSFHQSMMMSDGALSVFATRGISLALFILTAFILVTPAIRLLFARLRARGAVGRKRPIAAAPARGRRLARLVVPALVLAVAVVMLAWSYQYDGRTRMVPALTAWALAVLALFDIAAATGTRAGDYIAAFFTGSLGGPEGDEGKPQPMRRVLAACAWVTGYLGAVLLAGFHVATPVYVALYVIKHGKISVRKGVIAAVATAGFIALTFEWGMKFQLYRGVLFGG